MAVPQSTIWQIEPHSIAKHQILRKYLEAWFPIIGTANKRSIYVDGFSGPGRYTGGEPGSPIIALECARSHKARLSDELAFLFIEERGDRANYLNTEVSKLGLPAHFKVDVKNGVFATKIKLALDELDLAGRQADPTFVLIDPFGFSGIPYTLINRLLSRTKSEILITFMVDSINRWLTHPDVNIKNHIVDAFGTEEALQIAQGAADRTTALKTLYHRQLNKAARFVRYFELRDHDNRVVYYLFFASNNPVGHLKMKEAMWKVDPFGDFTFSDSTNPAQQIMFAAPATQLLALGLSLKFGKTAPISIEKVETYVYDHTAFVRKHMSDALRTLESDGRLKVAQTKTDGKKRRAGSFPNEVVVSFL